MLTAPDGTFIEGGSAYTAPRVDLKAVAYDRNASDYDDLLSALLHKTDNLKVLLNGLESPNSGSDK